MLNRKITAALVATAIGLVTAPAAGADQPYREPIELTGGILPGCAFDVQITPDGTESLTIFDSGRVAVHAHNAPTLTNVDTGKSEVYRLRYLFQETYDADANQLIGRLSGRFVFVILPGDVGPSGEVDEDGGLVNIVGRVRYTMDPDTFALTSFTVRGTMTDVCAELAS
jgi:hypothetical protein